ncbi:peptidoglycan D,D-transpeptidase FtsI family protein [Deinococcus lacus]|uniref:Peptidoglycan D,D-transpeptidase FtsI family protein n=1 Tax=Deinococcus lacus TaxID=392561 RepID=A0ABW1Y937_9DEIO
MEVKIRNRARIMFFLAALLFLSMVWAYAKLEWGMPATVKQAAVQSRGSILAADGTVLARSVDGERVYPQGALAGQLVGMMGKSAGLEGIERFYDDQLQAGENVTVTIDPKVQAAAEAALAKLIPEHQGEYGAAVVMEVRTGRLLAAASYPPFDPNRWREFKDTDRRNRPVLDVFEPGSVVKALVVGASLNEGYITPQSTFDTPMARHIGSSPGATIHDLVPHPPQLQTPDVLRYSSNVGMSHVVEKMPYEQLHSYLANYGFGRKTDMDQIYTETGVLQPLRKWDDVVRATNAFGQGMSSNLVQLAAAFNTISNDGRYVPPRLVDGVAAGERREVLSQATALEMRQMLSRVVQEGIPHAAGIDGYNLAGKTSTAQVVGERGYEKDVFNSLFASMFPADEPRITVAVMVHGAKVDYHGSQLAAPLARELTADIISQWGVAPAQMDKGYLNGMPGALPAPEPAAAPDTAPAALPSGQPE